MGPGDLHWLAGFLEGEGYFNVASSRSATVVVESTDLDVVTRAADLMCGRVVPQSWKKLSTKPTWRVAVHGARAEALMRELLPLMGARRSARIEEILAEISLPLTRNCRRCGESFDQPHRHGGSFYYCTSCRKD